MPISARHRNLFDNVILAKRFIDVKMPQTAKKVLDEVLDELINMETIVQLQKIEIERQKKLSDYALCSLVTGGTS